MGAALIAAALLGCGCEWLSPKYPSPRTGQPLTAPELVAERQAEEDRVARERADEERRLRLESARAKADVEAKLLAAETALRARVRAAEKSNRDAQAEVDAAADDYEHQLAEIGAHGRAEVERLGLEFDSATRRHDEAEASVARTYDTAFEALRAQHQQRLGIVQGIAGSPLVQSIPVVGPAIAQGNSSGLFELLLGGGGMALLAGRGRRREDGAYDEGHAAAKKESEEARAREHAAWDQSMAQMLALIHQPPAQVLSTMRPGASPAPDPGDAP